MVYPLSTSSGSHGDECFQKASFCIDCWVVPFLHPVQCEALSLECLSGPIKCLGKCSYMLSREVYICCSCTLDALLSERMINVEALVYSKFHFEDRSKAKLVI